MPLQVVDGGVCEKPEEGGQRREGQDLVEDGADLGDPPESDRAFSHVGA